jgi:hypothetical protein
LNGYSQRNPETAGILDSIVKQKVRKEVWEPSAKNAETASHFGAQVAACKHRPHGGLRLREGNVDWTAGTALGNAVANPVGSTSYPDGMKNPYPYSCLSAPGFPVDAASGRVDGDPGAVDWHTRANFLIPFLRIRGTIMQRALP